jgi:hypothetical protein
LKYPAFMRLSGRVAIITGGGSGIGSFPTRMLVGMLPPIKTAFYSGYA